MPQFFNDQFTKIALLLISSFLLFNSKSTLGQFHVSSGAISTSVSKRITEKYGIQIVNESDTHSERVLFNFDLLLENVFQLPLIQSLKNLKYLKASYHYDERVNIAEFDESEKSITVGGLSTYLDKVAHATDIKILAALSHEMGHAYLIQNLSASELREISEKYGKWNIVFRNTEIKPEAFNLNSGVFFQGHPLFEAIEAFVPPVKSRECNLVTGYSINSVHEWFAEAVAAYSLITLGEKNLLGREWKNKLVSMPTRKGDYWSNYNNLSSGFFYWMKQKLSYSSQSSSR